MFKYADKRAVSNCFLLEITPEELRALADRLEKQLRVAYPGQNIIIPISDIHTISMTVPYKALEGNTADR